METSKNIHILPTSQPSRLQRFTDVDKIEFELASKDEFFNKGMNIYITSDEEIKEGDWFYQGFDSIIHKCYKLTDNYVIADKPSDYPKRICKKIILTTDQDLIKDGVQAIPDDFLEWLIKNPSCGFVEVEKVEGRYIDYRGSVHTPISYKIIIPQEEPKQETLEETLGKKVVEYCKQYEGTDKYDVAMLAIEFGYALKVKEDE